MESKRKELPSFVVTEVVLRQTGKFTVKDILASVQDEILELFGSVDSLVSYIVNKLASMCEYGLIGRTELYYFSL